MTALAARRCCREHSGRRPLKQPQADDKHLTGRPRVLRPGKADGHQACGSGQGHPQGGLKQCLRLPQGDLPQGMAQRQGTHEQQAPHQRRRASAAMLTPRLQAWHPALAGIGGAINRHESPVPGACAQTFRFSDAQRQPQANPTAACAAFS